MQERTHLEMKASSDLEVGFPRESMHGHNLQIHSTEVLSNGQQVLLCLK